MSHFNWEQCFLTLASYNNVPISVSANGCHVFKSEMNREGSEFGKIVNYNYVKDGTGPIKMQR